MFASLYSLSKLAVDSQRAAWLRMMDIALGSPSLTGQTEARPIAERAAAAVRVSEQPAANSGKIRGKGERKPNRQTRRRR